MQPNREKKHSVISCDNALGRTSKGKEKNKSLPVAYEELTKKKKRQIKQIWLLDESVSHIRKAKSCLKEDKTSITDMEIH